jgi:hypothetical protein
MSEPPRGATVENVPGRRLGILGFVEQDRKEYVADALGGQLLGDLQPDLSEVGRPRYEVGTEESSRSSSIGCSPRVVPLGVEPKAQLPLTTQLEL